MAKRISSSFFSKRGRASLTILICSFMVLVGFDLMLNDPHVAIDRRSPRPGKTSNSFADISASPLISITISLKRSFIIFRFNLSPFFSEMIFSSFLSKMILFFVNYCTPFFSLLHMFIYIYIYI